MKGKKKWLTVIALVAVAGGQALATAGVVPPVIGNLLAALGGVLQAPVT